MASTSSLKATHQYLSRPQKRVSSTDTKVIAHSVLVDGSEHVVSYGGTGQYNGDGAGTAACGLAALNFARIVFSIEQGGLQDAALLQAVLARECTEETTAICARWSDNLHLEVEDISRVPLFEKTLKLKTTTYGQPGVAEFKSLLIELNNFDSSAAAIITRPPEILACLKLRLTTKNVFIIFDSHPRPSYPNGAGMTVSSSIEGTARRLTELLPTVDLDLPESSLQWQARLLSNYSGHVFVPHGVEMSTPILWQAVLESSLAQLSMQAEISDLRSQNQFLKNEQQRLESEIKEAEVRSRRQERMIQQLESSTNNHKYVRPSTPPRHSSSSTHYPFSSPSSTASASTSRSFFPIPPSSGSRSDRAHGHIGKPPTPPSDLDNGTIFYAMRLQHEFDAEDRALSAQRIELARSAQRLFKCDICMEELPEDSIARPDSCGHTFCRECLRGYVTARLDEHRFPILCPTCTANKGKGKGSVGEVSQSVAVDLGLTDEQYSVWSEMEMVSFSVIVYCRKCKRSMFVARDEHEEASIIACPLPDCNYAWCKQCQQSIDFDGPKHSCDGTSELDHLMKQQGWKYCPTCKTPIQKEEGCNHMSCMTPACNTHFCYLCGGLIVRSALGNDIKEAISGHYSKNCSLFAIPE